MGPLIYFASFASTILLAIVVLLLFSIYIIRTAVLIRRALSSIDAELLPSDTRARLRITRGILIAEVIFIYVGFANVAVQTLSYEPTIILFAMAFESLLRAVIDYLLVLVVFFRFGGSSQPTGVRVSRPTGSIPNSSASPQSSQKTQDPTASPTRGASLEEIQPSSRVDSTSKVSSSGSSSSSRSITGTSSSASLSSDSSSMTDLT